MLPDFNRDTIDALASRAAFLCSNPDCRVSTAEPGSYAKKGAAIGEAAHIHGARPDDPRYDEKMSDMARAEITNGIWLCRNCREKVDRDTHNHPAELLFKWREEHDRHVASSGESSERTPLDLDESRLREFSDYPPIIRRIIIDRPEGWEWRLTAELLRHLNRPIFRQLRDLQAGLYNRPIERVDENAPQWVTDRLEEMSNLFPPVEKLLHRLNEIWGRSGAPGDAAEIHRVCRLLRDAVQQMAAYEERVSFAKVEQDFESMAALWQNCVGPQALKLEGVPDMLDKTVSDLGSGYGGRNDPTVVHLNLTFELPEHWEDQMQAELQKVERKRGGKLVASLFLGAVIVIAAVVLVVLALP